MGWEGAAVGEAPQCQGGVAGAYEAPAAAGTGTKAGLAGEEAARVVDEAGAAPQSGRHTSVQDVLEQDPDEGMHFPDDQERGESKQVRCRRGRQQGKSMAKARQGGLEEMIKRHGSWG